MSIVSDYSIRAGGAEYARCITSTQSVRVAIHVDVVIFTDEVEIRKFPGGEKKMAEDVRKRHIYHDVIFLKAFLLLLFGGWIPSVLLLLGVWNLLNDVKEYVSEGQGDGTRSKVCSMGWNSRGVCCGFKLTSVVCSFCCLVLGVTLHDG